MKKQYCEIANVHFSSYTTKIKYCNTNCNIKYIKCKYCDQLIPCHKKFCNRECQTKYQMISTNNTMFKKHHGRTTREKISTILKKNGNLAGKNNPMHGKKRHDLAKFNKSRKGEHIGSVAKEKQRKSIKRYWDSPAGTIQKKKISNINKEWAKNNPGRHIQFGIASHKTCPKVSSYELKVRKILEIHNIEYSSQYKYKLGIADILIYPKLIVFVNGEYWHSTPKQLQKDHRQVKYLIESGYDVLIVWGKELKDPDFEDKFVKKIKMYE